MKLPRRLKQADIEQLIAAAVESGLLDISRDLLMNDIDPAIVLGLTVVRNPLEQFQLDLQLLGRIDPGRNEEPVLVTYLRNAAYQLRVRKQYHERTFEQFASMIRGDETKEEVNSPPFMLAGLVDRVDITFVPIPLTSLTQASGWFFLSSCPVPIGNDQDALSIETDRASLIRWLSSKRSMWPVRPPRPTEWNAAFVAAKQSGSSLPIVLPHIAAGRSFWCLEEDHRLLARTYEGRLVEASTADVWLIYELPR